MTGNLKRQDSVSDNGEKPQDYGKCSWRGKEVVAEFLKCAFIVCLFSVYFYRSFWACVPLCAVGMFVWKMDERKKIKKCRQELLFQFRDMIQSVEASIKAGYSLENAFLESYRDMCVLYGRDAMVSRELRILQRGLVMNIALEELLKDFGRRSGLAQIEEFAGILTIAKRTGGNMADVITASSARIQRMIQVKEEIFVQTAEKQMEQRIMNGMPFAILTYMEISNKGYFDVLYHNAQGIMIMTGCLIGYLVAYCFSENILQKALMIWEQEM